MSRMVTLLTLAATGVVVLVASAQAANFGPWGAGVKIDEIPGNSSELNTGSLDGCPIQSPSGLSLFIASNRPGGKGGLDIWVAQRASTSDPWGAPVNLGEPVNSAADDFCPTPVHGKGLYFVSRENLPGACGQGDIYFARLNPARGYSEPERLVCAPNGPNTIYDEQGPSLVTVGGREFLFFSTSSAAPAVPGDIYMSERIGGVFGPSVAVGSLNDATANDIQPNVRGDGREVVFSSNRANGFGAQDIWSSTRASVNAPWSAPMNLGSAVNTAASETRPSLSWVGEQLLFGRNPGPEGSNDIYVATRGPAFPK